VERGANNTDDTHSARAAARSSGKGRLDGRFFGKKNVWPAVTSSKFQLYKRVQQEIQIIQALQNQRLREQFYQQQALRMFQQQQMAAAMKMHNSGKLVS
jgi:microsomal dipeptidase-like Zn-dependent dipeptidase